MKTNKIILGVFALLSLIAITSLSSCSTTPDNSSHDHSSHQHF